MANDPISELVWQEHEAWLQRHLWRRHQRHRWQHSDWRLLYLLTEARWDQEGGMYLNSVARASWDVDLLAARRRLR